MGPQKALFYGRPNGSPREPFWCHLFFWVLSRIGGISLFPEGHIFLVPLHPNRNKFSFCQKWDILIRNIRTKLFLSTTSLQGAVQPTQKLDPLWATGNRLAYLHYQHIGVSAKRWYWSIFTAPSEIGAGPLLVPGRVKDDCTHIYTIQRNTHTSSATGAYPIAHNIGRFYTR